MAYIQLYEDAACTQLYGAFPTHRVDFTSKSGNTENVTVSGKTYPIFGYVSNLCSLNGCPVITANPPFFSTRNRYPNGKTFYLKNGLRFTVTEKSELWSNCSVSDTYIGTQRITRGGSTQVQPDTPASLFFVEFMLNGAVYYGFSFFIRNSANQFIMIALASTADFWEGTFRPPYDYSVGTDSDGGQATGTIPNGTSTASGTPSKIIPTGGRGLHTYLINNVAYGDIQGFLWGDNSTIAKTLWQKFQNKTHTPINCVLGCYSLPSVFMPSATGNTGVHLAGIYLSPISGTCASVTLGFVDKTITFAALDEPFHSFADYTCVACKLHLPIVGDITIPAEFIVNKAVSVRYRVDQMNGNTVARVVSAGQVIAELSGNCAYNVPITGGDDGTLARLGALANTALQLSAGNVAGALAQSAAGLGAQFQTQVANASMNGSTTACQNGYAYIEYIYPTTNYPAQYGQVYGYACSVSGVLYDDFKGGYGEFEVNIDSMEIGGATLAEKEEIRALLQGGIMVC